jgi:type VI protein secretion system component VasK
VTAPAEGPVLVIGGIDLYRTRTPRRLAAAAVVAIALSAVRVVSVGGSSEPAPRHTLDSAIDEVRTEIRATVLGIQRQTDYWEAHLHRMATDTRQLQERLGPG